MPGPAAIKNPPVVTSATLRKNDQVLSIGPMIGITPHNAWRLLTQHAIKVGSVASELNTTVDQLSMREQQQLAYVLHRRGVKNVKIMGNKWVIDGDFDAQAHRGERQTVRLKSSDSLKVLTDYILQPTNVLERLLKIQTGELHTLTIGDLSEQGLNTLRAFICFNQTHSLKLDGIFYHHSHLHPDGSLDGAKFLAHSAVELSKKDVINITGYTTFVELPIYIGKFGTETTYNRLKARLKEIGIEVTRRNTLNQFNIVGLETVAKVLRAYGVLDLIIDHVAYIRNGEILSPSTEVKEALVAATKKKVRGFSYNGTPVVRDLALTNNGSTMEDIGQQLLLTKAEWSKLLKEAEVAGLQDKVKLSDLNIREMAALAAVLHKYGIMSVKVGTVYFVKGGKIAGTTTPLKISKGLARVATVPSEVFLKDNTQGVVWLGRLICPVASEWLTMLEGIGVKPAELKKDIPLSKLGVPRFSKFVNLLAGIGIKDFKVGDVEFITKGKSVFKVPAKKAAKKASADKAALPNVRSKVVTTRMISIEIAHSDVRVIDAVPFAFLSPTDWKAKFKSSMVPTTKKLSELTEGQFATYLTLLVGDGVNNVYIGSVAFVRNDKIVKQRFGAMEKLAELKAK